MLELTVEEECRLYRSFKEKDLSEYERMVNFSGKTPRSGLLRNIAMAVGIGGAIVFSAPAIVNAHGGSDTQTVVAGCSAENLRARHDDRADTFTHEGKTIEELAKHYIPMMRLKVEEIFPRDRFTYVTPETFKKDVIRNPKPVLLLVYDSSYNPKPTFVYNDKLVETQVLSPTPQTGLASVVRALSKDFRDVEFMLLNEYGLPSRPSGISHFAADELDLYANPALVIYHKVNVVEEGDRRWKPREKNKKVDDLQAGFDDSQYWDDWYTDNQGLCGLVQWIEVNVTKPNGKWTWRILPRSDMRDVPKKILYK